MASSTDLLKLLLQDTGTPQLLEDTDYDAIVLLEENAYRAAATAARAISAKFAERVDMGGGSSKLALSQKSEQYLALAESYDDRAQQGGDGGTGVAGLITGNPVLTGISIEEMNAQDDDTDRFQGVFKKGQQDNPPSNYENQD